jgi:hypothetical protein
MVLRLAARLLPFALLLGACAEESAPLPPLPVYPPIEPMVLKIEGATACDIDADCDEDTFCFLSHCSVQCETGAECDSGICDDRGRCTESTNKSANSDLPAGPPNNRILGIEITEQPELEIQVSPDEEFVTVTFETSESVTPQGGLSYRIESSADDSLARRVQTSNGGTTHTVVIPTGFANPDFEGDSVSVSIVTPIGTIPLILKGLLDQYNLYEGTLKLEGLGTEIPIKFGILNTTDGEWFVVPSGYADIFGPKAEGVPAAVTAQGSTKEVRVKLEAVQLSPSVTINRGLFKKVYEVPAGRDSDQTLPLFARSPAFSQLGNSLQREVKYDLIRETSAEISGNWSDTWTSFYSGPAEGSGGPLAQTISISGKFKMKRSSRSADWVSERVSGSGATRTLTVKGSEIEEIVKPTGNNAPGYTPRTTGFAISSECTGEATQLPACKSGGSVFTASSSAADLTACANELAKLGEGKKSVTERVVDHLSGADSSPQSFEDFLAECATNPASACRPTLKRTCALEYQAAAFAKSTDTRSKEARWEAYVPLLLDVSAGLQLAAFYTDTKLRRKWLESASYASTAATGNAAATLNADLMTEYENKVLEPNINALRYFLAPSVFVFFLQAPSGDIARTERDRLLISMVAAWTAAADSLALSAQRWNEIYRLDAERKAAANKVAANLGELYRSAIVIMQLQRNAGRAAEGAPIATGLNTLLLRYELLTNSFNELLFARDGEVAVSTSLDPNNPGLLTQRREAALEAVDDASVKIDGLLEKLLENDIRNLEIYNGLDTSIDASQKRLLELCGKPVLPKDATATPDYRPGTAAGVCGFWQNATTKRLEREAGEISVSNEEGFITLTVGTQGTSDVLNLAISSPEATNVVGSEAALAVYDIGIARRNLDVAAEATKAALNNQRLIEQQVSDFSGINPSVADSNGTGNNRRTAFARRYFERRDQIQARYDLFDAQIVKVNGYENATLTRLSNDLVSEEIIRDAQIAQESVAIAAAILTAYATATNQGTTTASTISYDLLSSAAGSVKEFGDKSSECVKVQAGTSVYVGGPACAVNLSAKASGEIIGKTADISKNAWLFTQTGMVIANAIAQGVTAVTLASSNIAIYREQFNQRKGEIEDAQRVVHSESQLMRLQALENKEYADQENLTQYHADLDHLAEMLLEQKKLNGEYDLAVKTKLAQAAQLQRAKLAYYAVVAKAQREEATLDMLEMQRTKISALIAGPQAFFFSANGLTEAERELDRAKRKMSDWLVAIEYAAVRPFYSERMAILLARNTYQLRALADRLSDLEAQCGGETNLQKVTISLRKQTASFGSALLSGSARFRDYIGDSATPVPDVNIRYTVKETLNAQTSNGDLLVIPFTLPLDAFANLSATCNAKIESIALSVEGFDVAAVGATAASPFGEGAPYGTIIYHGDAKTYSCQPGIDAYITQFGQGTGYVPASGAAPNAIPESGTFGATTKFVVNARAASPVMAVNTLPVSDYNEPEMGSSNDTLKGLPVAGSYTLIIDTVKEANKVIKWDQLEDVKLEITYSYQDVFSSTSDCATSL